MSINIIIGLQIIIQLNQYIFLPKLFGLISDLSWYQIKCWYLTFDNNLWLEMFSSINSLMIFHSQPYIDNAVGYYYIHNKFEM